MALLTIALAAGCERDDPVQVDRNRPPETFITLGPDVSNDPRDPSDLFYRAHLFWRGEDADGTIAGFRFAIDDTADPGAWKWITRTDSVFRFEVSEIGSKEHLFLIRAVDNLGKQDPSPDTLRFESFTSHNPVLSFGPATLDCGENPPLSVPARSQVTSPTLGVLPLAPGDTVEVFSDIRICWSGCDGDGEVVGWQSKYDQQAEWSNHTRAETCRVVTGIAPGTHTVSVRAVDDAGATSARASRFEFTSNFDPVTRIRPETVKGTLVRFWNTPVDTLEIFLDDGMGGGNDTMPIGCRMEMCWESTDIDGPVVRYQWKIGQLGGQVVDNVPPDDLDGEACIATSATLSASSLDNSPGIVLSVKGIDVYANVESVPETLRVHVNFRPRVFLTMVDGVIPVDPTPGTVDTVTIASGGNHTFAFVGENDDGDPARLKYRWVFSFDPPFTQPVEVPGRSFTQEFDATTENVGDPVPHYLVIEAQDAGGPSRPSFRDSLAIWVVPPTP